MADIPHIPTSWGEVLDKVTILEIKTARMPTETARANAARELQLLTEIAAPVLAIAEVAELMAQLKAVNEALWEVEDRIREHERQGIFDTAFIQLARAVYQRNDKRSMIKRELNLALGSVLNEEKSYQPY